MRLKFTWAIDSETLRVRGIIVLVNPTTVIIIIGQKSIKTKLLSPLKARLKSFFAAKRLQTWPLAFTSCGL